MAASAIQTFKIVRSAAGGGIEPDPSGLAELVALGSRPVAVVSVMGALRTGKSTLQSILARHAASGGADVPTAAEVDASKGRRIVFKASDSGDPVTSGIDAAVIPRPGGQPDLLLLDVEGAGDKGQRHDMRVAVVASIVSSVLVLNTMGAPGKDDMLSRLGFVAEAAKAIAKGLRAAGSAASAPTGRLVVLARDYGLTHDASSISRILFRPEDDEDIDDDGQADEASRRNRVRRQLARAFASQAAMVLPAPGGSLRSTGESFDDAMRGTVLPGLLDGTAAPTAAPGGGGETLTAASFADAVTALCDAVSSEGFSELVPASIVEAMLRLAAERARERAVAYVSRAQGALQAWVRRRRGVPDACIREAFGRVSAELDRVVSSAGAEVPSHAAEIRSEALAALEAAEAAVRMTAEELCAGRRVEAVRLATEAVRAKAGETCDVAGAVAEAQRRIGKCGAVKDIDAVEPPRADRGRGVADRCRLAVVESLRRELDSIDASTELGKVADVSEPALSAADPDGPDTVERDDPRKKRPDSPGIETAGATGPGSDASLARRAAFELLHSDGRVPEGFLELSVCQAQLEAAADEADRQARLDLEPAATARRTALHKRDVASEEKRGDERVAKTKRRAARDREADRAKHAAETAAKDKALEAEKAKSAEAAKAVEAAEAARKKAEEDSAREVERARREAQAQAQAQAQVQAQMAQMAQMAAMGGGGMGPMGGGMGPMSGGMGDSMGVSMRGRPAGPGPRSSGRMRPGMNWHGFRTAYAGAHGPSTRQQQSDAYQAYKRGML